MRNLSDLKNIALITLLGATLAAAPVLAQTGRGMGGGAGGMRLNQSNTTGWSLMTPEERAAHRTKMRAATTYEECKAIQSEQHHAMEVRAKEKGETLPAPRQNSCDRMKARGIIK